jgi:radical SAM protein with 4Fe4S-binding SPASM domain
MAMLRKSRGRPADEQTILLDIHRNEAGPRKEDCLSCDGLPSCGGGRFFRKWQDNTSDGETSKEKSQCRLRVHLLQV